MSLYLLAVTPLTFYAACALLRERVPIVPLDLWRRFALGALLALPGYLLAGVVNSWFGDSYQLLPLFVRLTVTLHIVPAALAAVASLAVGLSLLLPARRSGRVDDDVLGVMAAMAGFGSIFIASELVGSGVPPNAVKLLIVPTLRTATLIALVAAWALRDRLVAALGITAGALLYSGAVSCLYTAGFSAPSWVFTSLAATGGAAALLNMRRNA